MSNPMGSALAFAGPLVDAQRAWSALEGHGIEAWLLDQTQGNLYAVGSVVVSVRATDLARAREVLEAAGLQPAGSTKGSR
jgi:hypothetical protein